MPPSRKRTRRFQLALVVDFADGDTLTAQVAEGQFPSREQRRNPLRACRVRAGGTMAGGVQGQRISCRSRNRISGEDGVQEPRRNPVRSCRLRERNSREDRVFVLRPRQQNAILDQEHTLSPPQPARARTAAAPRPRFTGQSSRSRTSHPPREVQPARAQPPSETRVLMQSTSQEYVSSSIPPRQTLHHTWTPSHSIVQDTSRAQAQPSSHTPTPGMDLTRPSALPQEPSRPSSHTLDTSRPSSYTQEPSSPLSHTLDTLNSSSHTLEPSSPLSHTLDTLSSSSHTHEPSRLSQIIKKASSANKELSLAIQSPSQSSSQVQTQAVSDSQPHAARRHHRQDATKEPRVRCLVCLESLASIKRSSRDICSTVCGHLFCSTCIETVVEIYKRCPLCRRRLTKNKYHVLFL